MSRQDDDRTRKRKAYESEDSSDDGGAAKYQRTTGDGFSRVIASHYNNIREHGIEKRKESRIFYLRSFNNWIKSSIIAQALSMIRQNKGIKAHEGGDITVLDLGCGKGGDLNKYAIGKIKHLVCVDIAKESLAQCQERYETMRRRNQRNGFFTAEFIHLDCTKESLSSKFKNLDIRFDLVSCQFTFHYSFESLEQAECMLKNISGNLASNGYFIGTTPDAYDIVSRVRQAGKPSFGNEVYSVNFDESIINQDPIPLFGARYDFHLEGVVDCPEFLVYFPALERIAQKYNLKMVFKRKFDDFYDENVVQRNYQGLENELLGKIKALETFPPHEPLKGDIEDYSEAQEYLEKNGKEKGIKQVGTISRPEWEAICLYIVFVFTKE